VRQGRRRSKPPRLLIPSMAEPLSAQCSPCGAGVKRRIARGGQRRSEIEIYRPQCHSVLFVAADADEVRRSLARAAALCAGVMQVSVSIGAPISRSVFFLASHVEVSF
jgi:hypothetical protein